MRRLHFYGGLRRCVARDVRTVAFGVAVVLALAAGSVRASDYPQSGGGPEHLATSAGEEVLDGGNVAQLRTEWSTSFAGVNPHSGTVVVADGIVFGTVADFGNPPTTPGFLKVYAADAETGAELWSAGVGGYQAATIPAVDDGRVFVSSAGAPATLSAFDEATGQSIWSDPLGTGAQAQAIGAPTVADDGTVYVVAGQTLYALEPANGTILWSAALSAEDVGGATSAPPAISDGVVYVSWGTDQAHGPHAHVTAFDTQTHALLWDVVGVGGGGIAAVGGSLYVASGGLGVYALDGGTGATLWHQVTYSNAAAPAVDLDSGLVIVETALGTVEARDLLDGTLVWDQRSLGFQNGVGVSGQIAHGVVYVSSGEGKLAALDETDGHVLWSDQPVSGDFVDGWTSPVVADGFLYFGFDRLYAYSLAHANADLSPTTTKAPTYDGDLVYTVTAHDAGPDMAYDVSVSDTIPSGTTLVLADSSQGTGCDTGTPVVCDLGQIASGKDAYVTVEVHLRGSQSYTNHAVVSSPSDSNTANNVSDFSAVDSPPVVGERALAYTSTSDGDAEIYEWNPVGIGPVNVTANPFDDYAPQWSPDGKRVVFDSVVAGNDDIFVMNGDGTDLQRLTTSAAVDENAVWSPDGRFIVFDSNRDAGFYEIYRMRPDGTGLTRLADTGDDLLPSYSPDGSKIAFTTNRDGNWEIYSMNTDGSSPVDLTNNPSDDFFCPSWSPNGSKIAFTTKRDGNWEIYTMNADGSSQANLTNNPANDIEPAWSPDGSQIAFARGGTGAYEIYFAAASGSAFSKITDQGGENRLPAWRPNIPGAPNAVHAVAGDGQATISFTPPLINGDAPVTSYTVTASPGGAQASNADSPITITGLSNGTTYTFTVRATSTLGTGAPSAPSNAVTPKANQTITFAALPNKTYGDAGFTVSATASSGLPVSFAASGSCTVSGSSVHITGAGSCTITASQAGNANYNAAPDLAQSFSIAKANQTITFAALPNKTYGDAGFTVSATASSGLPVSFAASGSCTVSGSSVHITGAGSCTITASQPGNANYNAATNVSRSFPIRCRVPNVVGKKLPAAKAAILRRGCRTGNVRRAYSRKVGKGRVSSQNLRAGRVVPARTKVNLVVSRGRRR